MKKGNIKSYARALYELTLDKRGAGLEKVIKNFVAHLAKARMLKQTDRIINEFIHYAKAREGMVEIEIESAYDLATTSLNHIKKVFGDKVEATAKLSADLLGGVVVRTKDKILDGSLRTQLNQLKIRLST